MDMDKLFARCLGSVLIGGLLGSTIGFPDLGMAVGLMSAFWISLVLKDRQ